MDHIQWEQLEALMAARGLSKYQLAQEVHYSTSIVYRYFNRQRFPHYEFILQVIRILDLTAQQVKDIFFPDREKER